MVDNIKGIRVMYTKPKMKNNPNHLQFASDYVCSYIYKEINVKAPSRIEPVFKGSAVVSDGAYLIANTLFSPSKHCHWGTVVSQRVQTHFTRH